MFLDVSDELAQLAELHQRPAGVVEDFSETGRDSLRGGDPVGLADFSTEGDFQCD